MKYTYSEEEDEGYSDATTSRRSTRNTGTHTPAEGLFPTVTQSGRQVKARQGGAYGESILSGAQTPAVTLGSYEGTSEEPEDGGRPRRAAAVNTGGRAKGGAHIPGYNSVDQMDSDEDDASEQDYGDDEEEDDHVSLGSDKDDAIDEDEDDDEDLIEEEVKMPPVVNTSTPEKKFTIKFRTTPRTTPEKDKSKLVDLKADTTAAENKPTTAALNGNVPSGDATIQKLNGEALAHVASEIPAVAATTTTSASVSKTAPATPLSPLALRSPERSVQRPPPSIDVGY